jgi:capsular polysaccharide biosynthesis protein
MLKRYWLSFAALAAIGAVAGHFSAAVITYMMPKLFESDAVIEVKPPSKSDDSRGIGKDQFSRVFVHSQIAEITGDHIISEVAERFEYVNKGRRLGNSTKKTLKEVLKCAPLEGNLISIRVRLPQKVDARDIAADLIEVFELHKGQLSEDEKARHKTIADELRMLMQKVDELGSTIKSNSSGPASAGNSATGSIQAVVANSARSELNETTQRIEKLNEELKTVRLEEKSGKVSVSVINAPQISVAPISPNINLNLLMGQITGIALSQIACLSVIYGLKRYRLGIIQPQRIATGQ